MLVCELLLKVPPPEVIDQAPVVAPPPTLAPANVMAVGVADWHTVLGPPGVTVAAVFTVITTVETAAEQGPAPSGSFVVKVNVTFPLVIVGV